MDRNTVTVRATGVKTTDAASEASVAGRYRNLKRKGGSNCFTLYEVTKATFVNLQKALAPYINNYSITK